MRPSKSIRRILFTSVAFAAVPLGIAGAASGTTTPTKTSSRPLPTVEHDKAKATRLSRQVKESADYERAVRRVSKAETAPAEAGRVADELSRFYAASPSQQAKFWSGVLDAAVKAKLLTAKDRTVLKKARQRPRATMAAWKPSTEFGRDLRAQALRGYQDEPDAEKSTAGDVGTILGGVIGGLAGGTPMSVGIGAAVGKVVGEAVNTLANLDGASGGEGTVDGGDDGGSSDDDE